jgi:hypothetical protein
VSIFRPLLIGKCYENGTVHNSGFFITVPVSLGLYYRGRQVAVAVEMGAVNSGGGRIKIGSLPIHCARNILPTPLYLLCAQDFTPNLPQNPILTVLSRKIPRNNRFWTPRGGVPPPGGSKIEGWGEFADEQCCSVGRIIKQIITDKFNRLGWRRGCFLFFR